MAALVWDTVGEREYETGVDHCVLYPYVKPATSSDKPYPTGVAWNGITGISESPSGAEATPLYADNIKYLNLLSTEEFSATITAYMYPDEFMACDGSANLTSTSGGTTSDEAGVYIGQQPRQTFGLSYRTVLGNDTETNSYGYKLHLIYGCLAAPSEKAYATINDSPEAIEFSWEISTTPVNVTGKKPTATVTIDATKLSDWNATTHTSAKLAKLEAALHGTATETAYLPLPDEIVPIMNAQ